MRTGRPSFFVTVFLGQRSLADRALPSVLLRRRTTSSSLGLEGVIRPSHPSRWQSEGWLWSIARSLAGDLRGDVSLSSWIHTG
jgi:hypothetical protein